MQRLDLNLSIYLSVCLSVCLSLYLPTYLPIYLAIYLAIYQSINQSIYLSTYLSIYLSIYPSIYIILYPLWEPITCRFWYQGYSQKQSWCQSQILRRCQSKRSRPMSPCVWFIWRSETSWNPGKEKTSSVTLFVATCWRSTCFFSEVNIDDRSWPRINKICRLIGAVTPRRLINYHWNWHPL